MCNLLEFGWLYLRYFLQNNSQDYLERLWLSETRMAFRKEKLTQSNPLPESLDLYQLLGRKEYSGRKLFAVLVVLSHMFDEERRDTAAYCLKLEFVVDSIVCTICQFIAKTCNETAE